MKVILTEEQLRSGIARMAEQIRQHYAGRPLTLVGVMTGSIMLMADLVRLLDMPIRVELILARNPAKGTDRPGPLVFDPEVLMTDVRGRHVLLVDDLFATGQTLWELVPLMDDLGPASVRTAVLLRKPSAKQPSIQPDFVGFDIPDIFVVGYGLDYNDRFRNLPYIAELEAAERGQG
jgi:hypoxanthine phosphoribosyltransferase